MFIGNAVRHRGRCVRPRHDDVLHLLQVPAHLVARLIRLTPLQRIDDVLVMFGGPRRQRLMLICMLPRPIDVPHHVLMQPAQGRVVGTQHDDAVEFIVQPVIHLHPLTLGRFDHGLVQALDLVQRLPRAGARHRDGGGLLQPDQHVEPVDQIGRIEPGDHGANMRHQLDQTLRLEDLQRIAHRRARHPEFGTQVRFRQPLTGRPAVLDDVTPQMRQDLLVDWLLGDEVQPRIDGDPPPPPCSFRHCLLSAEVRIDCLAWLRPIWPCTDRIPYTTFLSSKRASPSTSRFAGECHGRSPLPAAARCSRALSLQPPGWSASQCQPHRSAPVR